MNLSRDIQIDAGSAVPPFEQLRTRIASMAASGELPAGTRLATVRQLATDLGLATNTVARAYRELEADGVVATQGRRGTFVSSDVRVEDSGEVARLAREYVAAARREGLSRAEAALLVEREWGG
jgi:DNA-binding transcriptional regulator YhcF (GntR family)